MLRDHLLCFDEYVRLGGYVTSADFNRRLSKFDQIAATLVVDEVIVVGVAEVSLVLHHSGDSSRWASKGELTSVTLTEPSLGGAAWGYDDGAIPRLQFTRLSIVTSASEISEFTSARVRVYATQRDRGGSPKSKAGKAPG